jgi:hypothetical protein
MQKVADKKFQPGSLNHLPKTATAMCGQKPDAHGAGALRADPTLNAYSGSMN